MHGQSILQGARDRRRRRIQERSAAIRRHLVRGRVEIQETTTQKVPLRPSSPEIDQQKIKSSLPGLTLLAPGPIARRQFSCKMDIDTEGEQGGEDKQSTPSKASESLNHQDVDQESRKSSTLESYQVPISTFDFEVPVPKKTDNKSITVTTIAPLRSRPPKMSESNPSMATQMRLQQVRWQMQNAQDMAFLNLVNQYQLILRDCLTSTYRLERELPYMNITTPGGSFLANRCTHRALSSTLATNTHLPILSCKWVR